MRQTGYSVSFCVKWRDWNIRAHSLRSSHEEGDCRAGRWNGAAGRHGFAGIAWARFADHCGWHRHISDRVSLGTTCAQECERDCRPIAGDLTNVASETRTGLTCYRHHRSTAGTVRCRHRVFDQLLGYGATPADRDSARIGSNPCRNPEAFSKGKHSDHGFRRVGRDSFGAWAQLLVGESIRNGAIEYSLCCCQRDRHVDARPNRGVLAGIAGVARTAGACGSRGLE